MSAEKSGDEIDVKIILHKGRVRAALKKNGYNQKTFAQTGLISETTFSLAMNGNCSPETLGILAKALCIDAVHLLTDECREALDRVLAPQRAPSTQPKPLLEVSAVPDFTGRTKELADIAAHLQSGNAVCITAIKAAGGMGKTQLARRSAEILAAQYPDGTLLLELEGVETPKTPIAALKTAITKLNPGTEQLPESLAELHGRYLSALAGKKMLLILDNAADASQVAPLLKDLPKSVGVIITSRRAIVLPDVKKFDLEVMTPGDALQLLSGIVKDRRPDLAPDDLSAIAIQCGHLPLALRVAGTLLRDNRRWTRERFERALADDPLTHLNLGTDEFNVRRVLSLSVNQLIADNPEQAERFQMLSIFPATFAEAAAAAVWALNEDESFQELDDLNNRSLIEWDERTNRYHLHDLMRPVAREAFAGQALDNTSADRIARAERRFAEHYSSTLAAQHSRLLTDGLATFDIEVTNIAAALAWSNKHATDDPIAAKIFCHISLNGANVYRYRLSTAGRVTMYERCLALTSLLEYREAEARAKCNLGESLARLGDMERCLSLFREAAEMFEQLGDEWDMAVTMGQIADTLGQLGQSDEALRIRTQVELPVYERLGVVQAKAATMGKIADILLQRGQADEALRIHREEELPVYERLGDVWSKAVTMGKIAEILQLRGQPDEALRIHREEELPVYERLGDVWSKAMTMGQIADILLQRGQADEALRIRREEQLPVYEWLGDVRSKAVTMGKIADILLQLGRTDEALRIRREEELPVYERLGDIRSMALTMGKIADKIFEQGDAHAAIRIYREVDPILQQVGDIHSQILCRYHLAISLLKRGYPKDIPNVRELLHWALTTAENYNFAEAVQIRHFLQILTGQRNS